MPFRSALTPTSDWRTCATSCAIAITPDGSDVIATIADFFRAS